MRVVIVDDSAITRCALRGMLESEGFAVSEVEDGEQLLGTRAALHADLVICDMLMPGRSGLDVIRELRRSAPGVKIIAISGGRANGRADMLPTAMYLGADEVLYKPFSRTALLATLRKVMVRLTVS
jgi:DNA-binding response OmpR family regulator